MAVENLSTIAIVRKLSEGLVVVSVDGDDHLWMRVTIRGRDRDCAICRESIAPGVLAFRPLGNVSYRYLRIHAAHAAAVPIEKDPPGARKHRAPHG